MGCCCSKRVGALVDGGWNVHLGEEMVVCLVVIPEGRGVVVYLSPCVNPRERELARKREPEHENMRIGVERGGRNTIWYMVSYRTVLVSYRTVLASYRTVYGIVPYGIGPQGGKAACMCEKEACLLHNGPTKSTWR